MRLGAKGRDISDRELKCVFTLVICGRRRALDLIPGRPRRFSWACDGAASSSRRAGPREVPATLGRVDEAEDASLSGQITSASQAAV